jgi:hypothetical protein
MSSNLIKLNKRQFEWFNCDNGYNLFTCGSEEELQECTDKIFDVFDYVEVSEKDEIFGVKGEEKVLLGTGEHAYECAKSIK